MKKLVLLFLFTSTLMLSQNDTAKESPQLIVEQMPMYPGGQGEMVKFIQLNFKYPSVEREAGITGTCYVTFVVERDGTVSGVRTLRGVQNGPGCDKEAERIVNAMPKWTPGMQNGKTVRVQFNLPIKFTLNENDKQGRIDSKAHDYYISGIKHSRDREFEKAIKDFNKAIEIKPNYVDALYFRGIAHNELNDKLACADFKKVKEISSSAQYDVEELLTKTCK